MTHPPIRAIYDQSLALLTDFYQMTMSYGFWKAGLDRKEAVFHSFFRKTPFNGGYTIAAGLESIIRYLENFRFDQSDLEYLAKLRGPDSEPYFDEKFLTYLSKMRFSGDVDAVPEGSVVFPFEPLVRVQGPLIECQLLESPILNLFNFPSLIATKAARVCFAAKGEPVLEFGLRRAQGVDGALTASRAAFIGGCESTSNLLAGKIFGIPARGTHSHSWVMVFDEELEAFQTYAKSLPNNCVFLVDTFDTMTGVKNAIQVGHWLKKQGKKMLGVRLDSGDLADLSIKTRALLDKEGFNDAFIVGSNDLDEMLIADLKRQGAQITVWGVGTKLVTAQDQAALDGVYKLSAIRDPGGPWNYKLKLSEQMTKVSNPGILQIKRFRIKEEYIADVIYDKFLPWKGDCTFVDLLDPTRIRVMEKEIQSEDLLKPIFRKGHCIYQMPSLKEIRQHAKKELEGFEIGMKRFLNPHRYIVGMEKSLHDVKIKLIQHVREKTQ